MNARMFGPAAAIAVTTIVPLLLAGCNPGHYRAETTLYSDGSVDRAIFQPFVETPEAALQPDLWQSLTYSKRIDPAEWTGSIRELPMQAEDKERPYIAAWGHFDTVAGIPDFYVKSASELEKKSRLQRRYERVDHLFVVEHRFSETLTEVVTLEDIHQARRELAAMLISMFQDILTEGLGGDYDSSALIDWLKEDAAKWFEELTDAYIEVNVRERSEPDAQQALQRRVAEISQRHGLQEVSGDAFPGFLQSKLRELIRRKDGKPVEDHVVESILRLLNIELDAKADAQTHQESPLAPVAKTVISRRFGSEEEFEKALGAHVRRIQGEYGPLTIEGTFHYTMEFPGSIVETNGLLRTDNRVQWLFKTARAYPFGYAMTCRSIEANGELQRKLLGKESLAGRAEMLTYLDLLQADDGLAKAMQSCAKSGNLNALHDFRAQVEIDGQNQQVDRIVKLWALLQLTN